MSILNTSNPSILVTGGSGFIGRYLVKELKVRYPNASITVVDRTMTHPLLGVENIEADFSEHDIMLPLVRKSEYVFHLAGLAGVDFCYRHPELVRKVNFEDTARFIDLCAAEGVKKFQFTSSSEIYGNSPDIPYREEAEPSPVSVYGECKDRVARYLFEVSRRSQMQVSIVRPFNVYGPFQRVEFVVSIYCQAAIRGEDIVIFGDGEQTRCFTYIDDAIEGFLDAFKYESQYEIFNIGNDEETSINMLAEIVQKVTPNCRSRIVHQEYGKNGVRLKSLEVFRRVPSLVKARTLLGFEAKTDLETGIRNIVQS